ncbi:hypothetical protein [Microbacterium thalassium]|uniref:O-antigen ligase family protein n=1 Tax=Microbacterium thalassium TaxID=362649 RepID=A0A7X0FP89_9MICO|nr:hypothetical protein [Microbacterium thalassium]MBB6391071.1 hypothetical protein [Microbacterium thalassium]GLK23819.1 hypothetical protein GCM10017607_11370 [Microbacterium thalassium]
MLAIYVGLWCFEGAVRKWVPGTGTVMYVFRDAVLMITFVSLLWAGHWRARRTGWFWALALVAAVMTALQVIGGSLSLGAATAGVRSYLAPLMLLAFLLAFPPRRPVFVVTVVVAIALMANLPLVIVQVLSAPDSVVNQEIGGEAAYFVNPGEVVRPSGTFSAPIGLVGLAGLGAALGLAGTESKVIPRWVAIACVVAAVTLTALSGARTAVILVMVVVAAFVWMLIRRGSFSSLLGLAAMAALIAATIWIAGTLFPGVIDSFSDRVELASQAEETDARILGGILGYAEGPLTLFGAGAGAGSSAAFLALGSTVVIETESQKWVYELGVVGFLLATARLVVVAGVLTYILVGAGKAPAHVVTVGALFSATLLIGGVTQQPSTQGVFAIMLILLATRWMHPTSAPDTSAVMPIAHGVTRWRTRSPARSWSVR